MRCILKTSVGYYQQYFINLQENSIVGWFSGNWMKEQLGIADDQPLDVHFTYPKDGNFHQSVKIRSDNLEQYISVYWNKVKIKTIEINDEIRARNINEMTREEYGNNLLSFSVPAFKPEPLDNLQNYFFTGVALNIFNGSFKIHEWDFIIKEQDIKEDDLVVDVSNLDNVNVNISAAIRPKGEIVTRSAPSQYHSKSLDLSNNYQLILRCSIDPLPNE
jgi:hypothetical protein